MENALERRVDIKESLKHYKWKFVTPETPHNGQDSLRRTHISLIKKMIEEDLPYIIVAEDDLLPTEHFNTLFDRIEEADKTYSDVLLAGVCFGLNHIKLSDTLYRAKFFDGSQLIVYFNRIKYKMDYILNNHNITLTPVLMSSNLDIKIGFPFCTYQKKYEDSMCTMDAPFEFREKHFLINTLSDEHCKT